MHWLVFIIQWIEKMDRETLKFVNVQREKSYNIYKNTKLKLLAPLVLNLDIRKR